MRFGMIFAALAIAVAAPSQAAIIASGTLTEPSFSGIGLSLGEQLGDTWSVLVSLDKQVATVSGEYMVTYSYRTPACAEGLPPPACEANDNTLIFPLTKIDELHYAINVVVPKLGDPGGGPNSFIYQLLRGGGVVQFGFSYETVGNLPVSYVVEAWRSGAAVPEPETWAMLVAGFGLVGAISRRRPRPSPSYRPG